MVGGRHGRLYRQPSGDYALEAFGNHTFFVNDYPPQPNQPITGDATIRFGNSKGPVIRVLLKRGARSDGLKDTTDQDEVVPPSRTAAQIKKAVAALAVVVVVVAVALGGNYYLDHLRVQTVNQQLADMQDVMSKQAQEGFPPTESLRQAAFAVILENTNGRPQVIGTAWPLQAGMLVTNAHIAAVMDSPEGGRDAGRSQTRRGRQHRRQGQDHSRWLRSLQRIRRQRDQGEQGLRVADRRRGHAVGL